MTSIGVAKPGKEIFFVVLGFWIVYVLLYLLEAPFNLIISQYIDLRSEYTLGEQLSKLYLLIMMQVSLVGYFASDTFQKIGLNISFLLLGLCLYLSESNMISEETQPFFGLALLFCVVYFSVRSRNWVGLSFLVLGIAAIGGSSLLDRLSDAQHTGTHSLLSTFSFSASYLDFSEEDLDFFGLASFCLAVIVSAYQYLEFFLRRVGKQAILISLGSVLTAFGNGFIHYQYNPTNKLYLLALIMSIAGFSLFAFSVNKIKEKWLLIKDNHTTVISAAFFALFVYLPSIYGHMRNVPSLLIWMPGLLLIAWWLWKNHPAHQKT